MMDDPKSPSVTPADDSRRLAPVVPISGPEYASQFRREYADYFYKRGLTPTEVAQLKLTIVDYAAMCAELGRFPSQSKVPTDRIPYFDIDGSELLTENKQKAVRFRPHTQKKDEPKYSQGKGTSCFAYLAPFPNLDWAVIAADPGIPLLIPEGEYKGINACKLGIPAPALGGVCNFKNKKGDDLCTPLHKFEWTGRQVFPVFDADTESTPEKPFKDSVQRMLTQFCAMLVARGAKVEALHIARTKLFEPGKKMGLDDYLLAGGTIDDLLATRAPVKLDPHLAAMMEKYAFHTGTKPHVLCLANGHTYTAHEFSTLVEPVAKCKNPITGKMMKVSDMLREHPQRQVFNRYTFEPEHESGLDQERGVFNHWPGIQLQPKYNAEFEAIYVRFMRTMCGQHFDYIVNWFAHMVQRPWEKTAIALLCMSRVNGAGKSLLGEVHGALLDELYVNVPLKNVCSDKFNSEIANKLFVMSDEANEFFTEAMSRLKDIITCPTMRMEKKNRDAEILANLMRIYITTNALRPLRLEKDNRRLLVWTPPITSEDARGEWGRWIGKEVAGLKTNTDARAAILHYLMERDLSQWNPTTPVPMTEEMFDLADASPTKNMTVAQSIYEELIAADVSWVFVPTGLSNQDKQVWSDFIALVKEDGGQKSRHNYTWEKKTVTGNVYELRRRTLEMRIDDNYTKWLAGGQITGEQAEESGRRMRVIYANAVMTVKPFVR